MQSARQPLYESKRLPCRILSGKVASGGVTPFSWADITAGQQAVAITATDAQGTIHSQVIQLTAVNAGDIDSAINTINNALLQSSDTTLQNIAAIKDSHAGTGIRFSSTLSAFNVSLGREVGGNLGIGGAAKQGAVYSAVQDGDASTADISTEQGALDAVNLAQGQLSNLAAADSRIRDADLAAEATPTQAVLSLLKG